MCKDPLLSYLLVKSQSSSQSIISIIYNHTLTLTQNKQLNKDKEQRHKRPTYLSIVIKKKKNKKTKKERNTQKTHKQNERTMIKSCYESFATHLYK
jgi:hypothetical protein